MTQVTGWFLKGINFDEAPASLAELSANSQQVTLARDELLRASKWESLLQGKRQATVPGWVALETLASFRRGIATGANGFFLLSEDRLASLGIGVERCLPCVGRAVDVKGLIYTEEEFRAGALAGGSLYLLDLTDPLTAPEADYVREAESQLLHHRFLLKNRRPWYSMEKRPVAPIWAAVFGRSDLKFVFNEAGVRSLTNFHCIYPKSSDTVLQQALTLCLNTSTVRESSKIHGRVYGGGLNKFEPNDLKSIQVPDLNRVPSELRHEMASLLRLLNSEPGSAEVADKADALCVKAAEIAAEG